jgi:hypothetical protein
MRRFCRVHRGSIPEYGVSTSREISVIRTPGIGFIPNRFRTATWLWPPPTSTTSLRTGIGETTGVFYRIFRVLPTRRVTCSRSKNSSKGMACFRVIW